MISTENFPALPPDIVEQLPGLDWITGVIGQPREFVPKIQHHGVL